MTIILVRSLGDPTSESLWQRRGLLAIAIIPPQGTTVQLVYVGTERSQNFLQVQLVNSFHTHCGKLNEFLPHCGSCITSLGKIEFEYFTTKLDELFHNNAQSFMW